MLRWMSLQLLCLLVLALFATCQNDGIPPFSAIESHQVETINLQDLTIQLSAPVMNKPGAIPFSFTLNGFSNCAMGKSWSCGIGRKTRAQWQAFALSGIGSGLIGTSVIIGGYYAQPTIYGNFYLCPDGVTNTQNYSGWVIIDPFGTQHPLPPSDYVDEYGCTSHSSFTDITTDNSGLTLSVKSAANLQNGYSYIYAPDGTSTNSGLYGINSLMATPYEKDANGNSITASFNNSNEEIWIDSLGLTTFTSRDGSGNVGGYYKWTDVNGNTQQVSESFTASVAIKTKFGCSSVTDADTTGYLLSTVNYPDGGTIGFSYETNSDGSYTGRIGSITSRTGGKATFAYSGGNSGIDCTYAVPPTMTRTTQDGTSTYTWKLVNNGNGNYGNTTTVIDNGGNKTVYTFTGLTSTGRAVAPTIQALTQVQHYQNTGTLSSPVYSLLTTDVYCYNAASGQPGNCATAMVSAPVNEVDVYHTINGMSTSSRTQTLYDRYGNTTYSAAFDFGGTSPTSSTTNVYGSWNGSTCVAVSSTIHNKVCQTTTAVAGATVAYSRFKYSSTGNLLTTYVSPNGGTSFLSNTTPNSYNGNGTPTAMYDLGNNPTTYSYSSGSYVSCSACTNFPFPTSVSKGGLTTYSTWNGVGGVLVTSSNPNSSSTATTYGYQNSAGTADPFWRVSSATDPLGNKVWNTYSASGPIGPYTASAFSFGSSVDNEWNTIDGYGRSILFQKAQSASGTTYDTTSTSYGWSGAYRSIFKSVPCSVASAVSCSTGATTLYDALGRPSSATDSGSGVTTNTYAQNDVLSVLGPAPSGENQKQTQTQYDGVGRMTSLCNISSTASGNVSCAQNTNTSAKGVLTSYSYAAGTGYQTTSITRGVQTRSKTTDGLGRVTQTVTPEGGTTNYVYDSATSCGATLSYPGRLMYTAFANGNTDCYQYDVLGRVVAITGQSSGGTVTCRRYYYDNSTGALGAIPNGITIANQYGRVVEAETDTCAWPITSSSMITDEWFSYDQDGNHTDIWELTPHSGTYYHSHATFAGNGVPLSVQLANPNLYTETYSLDGEGRLNSLISASQTIVAGTTYNAASQPVDIDLGTGTDQSDYVYDANTGRMTNWTFQVGSAGSETGALTWNPNGTLRQLGITDGYNAGGSQTCTFGTSSVMGYDDLGRLLSDNCGSVWAQTFTYDQYDNLTKSGSSAWNPGYNPANSHYSSGAAYDNSGNLLSDSIHTYKWDQFEKLSSIDSTACGTNGECVIYDALGRAVETSYNSTYTEIWYTQLGKTVYMHGSTPYYAYWPTPGNGTVEVNGNAVSSYYMHKDWLGNSRISSGVVNHTVISDQAYAPYGEVYNKLATGAGVPAQMFTGDTQDIATGIFDTPNRELNAGQGRWLSPDPAGSGWNQYAYSANPNSSVDPSGLVDCLECWGGGGGGGGDGTWLGSDYFTGAGCDPTMDPTCIFTPRTPFPMTPHGGGGGVSFNFGFEGFSGGCDSDFMPCGMPAPGLWETLGLPTGLSCPQGLGPMCGGVSPIMDASPANTETISAYHPSVSTCLGQAAISAGEDLLGVSMLPGSDQDNWAWSSDKLGFVYTGAAEADSLSGVSNGVDLVGRTSDFVADTPAAQGTIRQFLRSEGVKVSLKHVSKDAAWAGKWAGRAGKVLAAVSAYERYQKCRGN